MVKPNTAIAEAEIETDADPFVDDIIEGVIDLKSTEAGEKEPTDEDLTELELLRLESENEGLKAEAIINVDVDEEYDEGLSGSDKLIKKLKLLPKITREEEVSLAQQMEAANTDIGEQLRWLELAWHNHDYRLYREANAKIEVAKKRWITARDRLITGNMLAAFYIACWRNNSQGERVRGLQLEDIAQFGNIGLIKAAPRYEWRRGFRFITYASWWIRLEINHGISNTGPTVRLPLYVELRLRKLNRARKAARLSLNRWPTDEEVAGFMESSIEDVKFLKNLQTQQKQKSLSDPLVNNEGIESEGGMDLPDKKPSQDEILMESEQKNVWVEAEKNLTPEQFMVIRERYYLGKTLQQIGDAQNGKTREWIRQIQKRAIKKLKFSKAFAHCENLL